ncbi:unnamed protein product [Lactuca virosa]|uniref:Retrotransposon gag domain-containing protein n=1 Tax=Lactuca virosa TaxID=75947 RepID=A0AAU9PAA1_9ASTR|nr:unnamed protein product [Lactuca virosa]
MLLVDWRRAEEKPANQGTIASRNNGNEPQDMDQDQGHHGSSVDFFSLNTLANDINRCIGPMVNKLEDLGTRLKHIEVEVNKYAPMQDNVVEIPTEEKPSHYNTNIGLPTFPEKFNLDVFCKWVKELELYFEYHCVAQPEQVELVVSTLPQEGEAFKWWQDIQKLNEKVYKNDPIWWAEMKVLFMDKFLSP